MTEGMRWRVTKAVRRSGLPAPSRLLMLTLADVAEVGTAEIPPQHTPSLTVLATETGLDRSTVTRHLNALEVAGWLVRMRPTVDGARYRSERTRYRLAIPGEVGAEDTPPGAQSTSLGAEDDMTKAHTTPSPDGAEHLKRTDLGQTEDRSEEPPRVDVEQVCRHLADKIEANGSKRPTITKKWRTEARLLLDRDGRTVEQVTKAIDWCQDHTFWKSNILSMPKLREQYDRLRLEAQREAKPKASTTDQRVAAGLALAAELERRAIHDTG